MQNTVSRAAPPPFELSQKLVSFGTWKDTILAVPCLYQTSSCDGPSNIGKEDRSESYQNQEDSQQLKKRFWYTRNKVAEGPVYSMEVSLEQAEQANSKKEELESIQNGVFQIPNIPPFEPRSSVPTEQICPMLPFKSDAYTPNIFKLSESVIGDFEANTLNFCLHLRSVLDLKNQQCIFAAETDQSQKLYSFMLSRNKLITEQIQSYRKKRRRVKNKREKSQRTLLVLPQPKLHKLESKSKLELCNLQGINTTFKTKNIDSIIKKAKKKLLERASLEKASSVIPFRLIELQDEQCSKENHPSPKKKCFNQLALRRSMSRKKLVDCEPSLSDSILEKEMCPLGLSNKPFGFVTRLKPLTKEERADPEGLKNTSCALGKIMRSLMRVNRV